MKILFVMPRFHTNLNSWIRSLQAHGHVVDMFVLYQGATEDYSILSPKKFGLNFFSILISRFLRQNEDISSQLLYGIPPLMRFIRNFFRFNPDIVVIRSPNTPFGFLACILSTLFGKYKVIYTQGPKYFSELTMSRILFYFLFIKIFRSAWMTPVLGNNNEYKKTLREATYIPFAVNISNKKYLPSADLLPIRILSVGKYELRKNHHLLINAVADLAKNYSVHLTIIGECSRPSHYKYLKAMEKQIQSLGVKQIISLKTNIDFQDMDKYYSQNHFFVLPSTRECASIANLEAMAYGLPVICSDTNGTACYTLHNVTGFLFKDENYTDLYRYLNQMVSDTNLVKKMAENTINNIACEYTEECFYQRFASMLKKHFDIII